MSLPTSVDPVNATLSTSSWAASAAPGGLAEAGHHVHHTVGDSGLGDQPGQPQRGQRGLLGGLEHHGVPGRQRRGQLPRGHQQREVPRDDLPDHADRLAQRIGMEVGARHVRHRDVDCVALDLGRPPGHVVEHVRGQRHVGRLGHRERLAVVQRLQLGQLIQVLQDQVADPPDNPAPLRRGHPAPRAPIERGARRPYCPVDVLGVPLGHPGEGLARRRVGGLERLARRSVGPLPIDKELTWNADKLLHAPVQGHSHECSSPIAAAASRPACRSSARRPRHADNAHGPACRASRQLPNRTARSVQEDGVVTTQTSFGWSCRKWSCNRP